MPFVYTHLRFGNRCKEMLPNEIKDIVNKNIYFFNYGTLGPNILCYHSPFTNKKYNKLNFDIHNKKIQKTIINSKRLFTTAKNRDAVLSYLLGYISHFILDTYCNKYLLESSKVLNIHINHLYGEIDKYYFKKDDVIQPKTIINSYKYNNEINTIISLILRIKEQDIKQSTSNFNTYIKILLNNNRYVSSFIKRMINILKKNQYGYLLYYSQDIQHYAQIIRIEKYFEIARLHYKQLVNNIIDYIYYNNTLDTYFENSFINTKNNIKILSIDEEKKYFIEKFME